MSAVRIQEKSNARRPHLRKMGLVKKGESKNKVSQTRDKNKIKKTVTMWEVKNQKEGQTRKHNNTERARQEARSKNGHTIKQTHWKAL